MLSLRQALEEQVKVDLGGRQSLAEDEAAGDVHTPERSEVLHPSMVSALFTK